MKPEKQYYSAKHKDTKIQISSSSGGVFTAISDVIIDEGGTIFGGVQLYNKFNGILCLSD